jgi:hypothetical protein
MQGTYNTNNVPVLKLFPRAGVQWTFHGDPIITIQTGRHNRSTGLLRQHYEVHALRFAQEHACA